MGSWKTISQLMFLINVTCKPYYLNAASYTPPVYILINVWYKFSLAQSGDAPPIVV